MNRLLFLGDCLSSYAKFSFFVVLLLSSAARAVELSPQDVVDLALKQSLNVKKSELTAQQSEASAEVVRGAYDLILKIAPKYEYTEAQSMTGTSNPIDRTWTLSSSLNKALSSGTALTLQYDRTTQESTLSSFSSSLRRPTAAMDVLTFTIRQALWRNIFGQADRATLESADASTLSARMAREETLEDVILKTLSLYWNAFVAETQLRENTAARQKYEELVKAVRRKAGFNLSSPGELPRLEAEFEASDSRVKQSSRSYLAAMDELRTALQMTSKDSVTFKVQVLEPADLPAIPKLASVDVTALRPYRIAQIKTQIADRDRTVAQSSSRPKLDLVATAKSTGVDDTSDLALSEMASGSKPTYSLGLELEWPLDSATFRGKKAVAEVAYQSSALDLKLAEDTLRDGLSNAERAANANHETALSTIEIVNKRTRVVRELEASYRQGRTPLVELIRAYNDLFAAQQERAKAIGDYQVALNQWAAYRDELVKNEGSKQ